VQTAIPCVIMRGGTSKGLYFHARDLPADEALRERVLCAAMGSPDPREIDGLGGAHPLTSKVGVVAPPTHADADMDYLFLQVVVDEGRTDTSQNCGNILAGVGPFAIEEGLVKAQDGFTDVRIHMVNSKSIAVARVQTPGGKVEYDGDARIDGVPRTHAPIPIDFLDVAGSSCGSLLPLGVKANIQVVMRASDFGKSGYERPEELEADSDLKARVEKIRLEIGPKMNLGDVTKKTIPKMCLVAPPQAGGVICTRNFIPHRVHEAIGVFGAVSVATACVTPGSIAAEVAGLEDASAVNSLDVEHPTGFFTIAMDVSVDNGEVNVKRSALLRTARKIMRGEVYVRSSIWDGK
jgi:4-oxalomesaconate tautomerase